MCGRDRRLELVDARPAEGDGSLQHAQSLVDTVAIPERPVLVLEQHELAARAQARVAARVLEEHEREEAQYLRLVGHQHCQELAEPDRLLAELLPDVVAARRRRVPLVEDEVEDGEHGAQPLGEQVIRRHAERDPRGADLLLRSHEPLGHRRLRDEERVRDLRRREPADLPECERDPAVRGERGVAAREDEGESLVGNRAQLVLLCGKLLQACEQLGFLAEDALAANPVDRPVAGRRDDPCTRLPWEAVASPALECDGECVLHRILGQLEVAENAREDRDGMSPLLAEDLLDGRLHSPTACSLNDWANLDGSAALCRWDQGGQPDRLVEVGKLGEEDASDDLLRLCEWAVGDDALPVADAHDLRGAAPVELLTRDVRIGLAELLEKGDPLRHLLRAEGRFLVIGEVDPRRVVIVDEHRVLHSCTSSGST